MDFIVKDNPTATDLSTPVVTLNLPAETALGTETNTRQVSLNELVSDQVCVEIDTITGTVTTLFSAPANTPGFAATCLATVPSVSTNLVDLAGPRQALLGVIGTDANNNVIAVPKIWMDPITETPLLNSTEVWEIFNTTMDAHPIHLHLVRFEVVGRQDLDPAALLLGNLVLSGVATPPKPNEMGFKDTVVAYPGQITRIRAKFDIAGLYVWHCHIVEHEDNEMMRPYVVKVNTTCPDLNGNGKVDNTDLSVLLAKIRSFQPTDKLIYDLNNDGKLDLLDARFLSGKLGSVCP